ncbi:hypothetical protein RQP46_001642 [Phenoliferia psychrophenolica]
MATADPLGLASLSLPQSADLPFTALPSSGELADVFILDGGGFKSWPRNRFADAMPGSFDFPSSVFLIKNRSTGKTLLYDLGVRSDLGKYPKPSRDYFESAFSGFGGLMSPAVSIPDQLQAHGVEPSSIDAVVISHTHFDHTGDLDHFPTNVGVVIGPGALASYVGSLRGMDWWGDGSVYILDTPGHLPGHLGMLVRTSSTPSSFLLLVGDASHHRALFTCCTHTHYKIPTFPSPTGVLTSAEYNLADTYATLARVQRMEREEDVMVVMAHDPALLKVVERHGRMWPGNVNGWKAGGWKAEVDLEFEKDREEWA